MPSKALVLRLAAVALLLGSGLAQTTSFVSTSGTGQASASSQSFSTGTVLPDSTLRPPPAPAPQPAAAAAPPAAPLPSSTQTLQPFTAVSLCAPINLLVVPNATDNYSFTVTAEEGVQGRVSAEVGAGGVLAITASGPFATNATLQLTASLPAGQLAAFNHYGPGKEACLLWKYYLLD